MTRGNRVSIPFLGINKKPLDDQSIDGLCDSIVNLKPNGPEKSPYWVPFETLESLTNDSNEDFTYEFGIGNITDAFWQIRNNIGEYAETETSSLKRLLVLCQNPSRKCIDIVEPDTWEVVKTQALPSSGTYTMSCTRVDEVTVIAISKDKKPFLMYYLIDDSFIPQGWPEMPEIAFSTDTASFTTPEVEAGNYEGVLRKSANDQYFMITWAFKLFDSTHVKHNRFELITVTSGTETEAVRPIFTLEGYDISILVNEPFWKSLISGISVFCTRPVTDKKNALDDGNFYEVGFWPFIDVLPASQWPTVEDPNILTIKSPSETWPVLPLISNDDFTHHKFSSYVVDSYNKRLLLGGSAVDFAKPKVNTNATKNTVPGGVYSDYMNFNSGSGGSTYSYYLNDGTPSDFNSPWDYEVDEQLHISILTPKTGREFKTVTIVESIDGDEGTTTPNGQNLPYTNYVADLTTDPGKLFMSINAIQSDLSGTSLPGQVAKMRIKLEIGPTGEATDEVIYFWVQPGGNQSPYVLFSDVELETDTVIVGAKIYHRITIKTNNGTYYRVQDGDIADTDTSVTLPEVIWYPDARAVLYELIVENAGEFELAISKQLNQHPVSNYAYVILSVAEQTYDLGTNLQTIDEPTMAVNDIFQYVPNRAQASISGNPFIFQAAATYYVGNRERDIIMGFAVNTNPTSEGQAGQYPVFILSNKGVWTLEQISDPTIAFGKISQVSNFNGLNNPYSYCNAQSIIIAADNKYIYTLKGLTAVRIDEAISDDPDYKDFIKQMRVGYHRASNYEEVIFSNPFYDYSLCYNLKYGAWYKSTNRYKFFFYDYPDLLGMTVDNELKDFENKNTELPVAWSIQTRPLIFNEPYMMKRLFHNSIVRMQWKQPLQENAENYPPINVKLLAYRDSPNVSYTFLDHTFKTDFKKDWMLYQYYGPVYAYRLIMSGNSQNKGSYLHGIDADVTTIHEKWKRRYDCSSQFLFSEDPASLSICHCAEGSGTDAYFNYTGAAATSQVITHGLNKIPGVLVTDLDGYVISCGVQLVITEGEPSLTQIRLTFEDPIPYKAHFY